LDKKTLPIVILLVIIILFYWQILQFFGFVEPAKEAAEPPAELDTTSQQAPALEGSPESTAKPQVETPDALARPPAQAEQAVTPTANTVSADIVIIKTAKYTAALSTSGGGPLSIELREYAYRDGRPIEMLPGAVEATPDARFSDDSFSTSSLHYRSSLEPRTYDVAGAPLELAYTYRSAEGGEIVKTYVFYPDQYHFDLRLQVNHNETFGFERFYTLMWNTSLGVTEPDTETDYGAMEAVAMQSGSRVKLDDFDDGLLNQRADGSAAWAGLRAKYFAAVMIPQDREAEAVVAQGRKLQVETRNGQVEGREIIAGMRMQVGAATSIDDNFRVFVGPLDYTLMSRYGVGLEDMLGIGTTPVVGWIIKPFAIAIIWLLPRMYSVVANYGFVIILFALLVKIITLPLSMKSFKSMNAMKELQPKIEQLKEKYKKNPQALNKEMMSLYKKHGVNPVSGCLPILPQMPLFFALFSVFRSTILLRDAPFVWFISDLSRGATGPTDPYIILVVLMVATQFISQKLTMATNQQNKMFLYIMPVFMGFIFYRFAAGLVLYWTCFSFFSLLDYVVFKRRKATAVRAA